MVRSAQLARGDELIAAFIAQEQHNQAVLTATEIRPTLPNPWDPFYALLDAYFVAPEVNHFEEASLGHLALRARRIDTERDAQAALLETKRLEAQAAFLDLAHEFAGESITARALRFGSIYKVDRRGDERFTEFVSGRLCLQVPEVNPLGIKQRYRLGIYTVAILDPSTPDNFEPQVELAIGKAVPAQIPGF